MRANDTMKQPEKIFVKIKYILNPLAEFRRIIKIFISMPCSNYHSFLDLAPLVTLQTNHLSFQSNIQLLKKLFSMF